MGGQSRAREIDPIIATLKRRREELGLTQVQLAILAETQQSSISDMETGLASPTLHTLSRIAECLGVKLAIVLLPPNPAAACLRPS